MISIFGILGCWGI